MPTRRHRWHPGLGTSWRSVLRRALRQLRRHLRRRVRDL